MQEPPGPDAPVHHQASDIFDARRRPGDLAFATLSFAVAVLLLALIGTETRWYNNVQLTLQPRFAPAVVLICLTLFSGLYLLNGLRARRRHRDETPFLPPAEIVAWARPVEFALWFVAYGAAVPWLGYLLATVVFLPLVALRVGYRARATLLGLALLGVGVVLFFKTGLQVKMPAGALYDVLPDAARNFFIRNF